MIRFGSSFHTGNPGSFKKWKVRSLHAQVVEKLGHPDILFNNSGTTGKVGCQAFLVTLRDVEGCQVVGRMGDIENVTIDEYEKTWKVNTGSSYLVYRCLPRAAVYSCFFLRSLRNCASPTWSARSLVEWFSAPGKPYSEGYFCACPTNH